MEVGRGSRVQRLTGGQEKQAQHCQEDELPDSGRGHEGQEYHRVPVNSFLCALQGDNVQRTFIKRSYWKEVRSICGRHKLRGPWNVNVTRLGIRAHDEGDGACDWIGKFSGLGDLG